MAIDEKLLIKCTLSTVFVVLYTMISALINNPLFRGITPNDLSAHLEEIHFHVRSYKKGEILARQGDRCNRLIILIKGSVRGEMIDYSGRLIKVEDINAPRALAPLFFIWRRKFLSSRGYRQ